MMWKWMVSRSLFHEGWQIFVESAAVTATLVVHSCWIAVIIHVLVDIGSGGSTSGGMEAGGRVTHSGGPSFFAFVFAFLPSRSSGGGGSVSSARAPRTSQTMSRGVQQYAGMTTVAGGNSSLGRGRFIVFAGGGQEIGSVHDWFSVRIRVRPCLSLQGLH